MEQWVWALGMHSGSWSLDHSDWEFCLNKLCFSIITYILAGRAGVWVEQEQYGPGAYLVRCWGTYLELGIATESSSLDSRKKLNSFISVSVLSTSPVNHFFNIQSSRTEFRVGSLHRRVIFIPNVWQSQIWTLALSRKAWQQFTWILNKAIKDAIGNGSKNHRMYNRQVDGY